LPILVVSGLHYRGALDVDAGNGAYCRIADSVPHYRGALDVDVGNGAARVSVLGIGGGSFSGGLIVWGGWFWFTLRCWNDFFLMK